jgi:hypothetical protein
MSQPKTESSRVESASPTPEVIAQRSTRYFVLSFVRVEELSR